MKKTLMIITCFASFNLMAKWPNLSGTYSCLNYQGHVYEQTISIKETKGGIAYVFSKNKQSISWTVDGKQHVNIINAGNSKIKMLNNEISLAL